MGRKMSNKKTKITLSVEGIDHILKSIEDYKRWLKERSSLLLDRLSEEGYQIASANFEKAVYDGTNDVSVSVEQRGEGARAIVAVGASVLFIEFGTGVVYPDNHPEAAEHGMRRGEYGKGHGKQTTWGYYGEPGTNGRTLENSETGDLVLTHGNPANMSMYEAVKELKQHLPELAREIFQ